MRDEPPPKPASRSAVALVLLRASALVYAGALLLSVHLHVAAFRGAELEGIMRWHWPLALTAFFGLCACSILFLALGHAQRPARVDLVFVESSLGWPDWVTVALRVAAVYAVVAFFGFFVAAEAVVEVDGRHFLRPEDGGERIPLSDAEHETIAVAKQRGVTALYLPIFLILTATALCSGRPDEETPSETPEARAPPPPGSEPPLARKPTEPPAPARRKSRSPAPASLPEPSPAEPASPALNRELIDRDRMFELLSDPEGTLYLDVVCGGVGMYGVLIELTEAQAERYREGGHHVLNALALRVRRGQLEDQIVKR